MARQISDEEIARLKVLWADATITQEQIARQMHRSESRIRELGLRHFGRRPKCPSILSWLPEDIATLERLFRKGLKPNAIARLMGRGTSAVVNALWKYKIRNRTAHMLRRRPDAMRMLRKRRSISEIVRIIRVSARTVRRWRDEAGIVPLSRDEVRKKKTKATKKSVRISGGIGRTYAEREDSIRQGWPWCHAGHRQLLERLEQAPVSSYRMRSDLRRRFAAMVEEGWVYLDGTTYRLAPAVIERRAEYRESLCTTQLAPTRPACTVPATEPIRTPEI